MLKNLEKFSLSEIEEKVLAFWQKDGTFKKSVALRQARGKKHKKFVFYEGPPTANAKPGIHHVLARVFKDIIPRYKTMRGFFVPRRAGWDTHGLPVELQVEKELGFKSKKDIEKYSIAEFNKKCKESVWEHKKEFEDLTTRMGFWLDMENPYVTYESSYMESLWSILKRAWEKKLLYKGHRVVPWCTRCGTPLSSHELAQGYKEVEDEAVYVKFRIKDSEGEARGARGEEDVFILSWTTTPWTLPGNVALAINPKVVYCKVKSQNLKDKSGDVYVLAKSRLSILGDQYEILEEVMGRELVGLEYEPLFDIKSLKSSKSYKIYAADFVTTDEGTGVVHTAVMYGEDDYQLGESVGLPKCHTVDEQGRFTEEVQAGLTGLYVKAKGTEEKIISELVGNNFLLKTEKYKHDYPFCWRCGTALLYYARDAWFIAMSRLRDKLISANKKINWIPEHIKEGRFGEWLHGAKDWAISRNRYWATPLPIWGCGKCEAIRVVGDRSELSAGKKANNTYFLMRHGESESNVKKVTSSNYEKNESYPLTFRGRAQVEKAGIRLKKEGGVDLIFASDFLRTRDTAEIVASSLKAPVYFDKRLREVNTGIFDGRPYEEYENFFNSTLQMFAERSPEGENLRDLAKRVSDFIFEVEKKHKGKTILIVSHESPLWMLEAVMSGWGEEEVAKMDEERDGYQVIDTGEARKVSLMILPRGEFGFCDLHRPYVDDFKLTCGKCGGVMERVSEVADVWFDSGAMPWASVGIQNLKDKSQKFGSSFRKRDYPADYICEAIDQTRGWFYTLLAVAVFLGEESPYKNVICLGHVLDKNGQKMSKSKGNTVDPWEMINKYGIDAIRWYFYVVNPPGEPKKFDEKEIGNAQREFFNLIYNCFVFYDTYAFKAVNKRQPTVNNALDRWVLARLNETISGTTKDLEDYEVGGAARKIEEFVGDLSRWYIRRSRRRLQKPDHDSDYKTCSATLGYALFEVSRLVAPFAPFFSEALYSALGWQTSVHLEDWPSADKKRIDKKLLDQMKEIRRLSGLGLAKRAEAGIKVRQPLASLKIKNEELGIREMSDLLEILKDEVNVKEIIFDSQIEEDIFLDVRVTGELREEGVLREFIRMVQMMRSDAKLKAKDIIMITLETSQELKAIIQRNESMLKREINADVIKFGSDNKFDLELSTKLDSVSIKAFLKKV